MEEQTVENKIRIGILRGGEGDEYDSSLRNGGDLISHILENLKDKFKVLDILVDRDGVWHISGVPVMPSELVHKVDAVWNTSHPSLSQILKNFSIPVVGSSSFASAIGSSRSMLEEHMKNFNITMPRHLVLPVYQEDLDGSVAQYAVKKSGDVFRKFSPPWIARSLNNDPSMGVHVAKTLPELERAIEDGVNHDNGILVEELIAGDIASVHSVRGFRGEDIYTFPILGNAKFVHKEELANVAKRLHSHLGEYPYIKSNFVVSKNGKIYLTGVLFTPNLKENSHFCKSCELVAAKPHHVIEHILESAL